MAKPNKSRHTGTTASGSTRDVVIDHIGRVTIYQRGNTYFLYYREKGRKIRRKVDGNLATAVTKASRTSAELEEGSPSAFGFTRISVDELVRRYLEYCEEVQGLAMRTIDRYRAALTHLRNFAEKSGSSSTVDQFTMVTVEDFVKWLRKQSRTRNGSAKGKSTTYTDSGIKFILNTARTAFNWAKKRYYLPPHAENPFSSLRIELIFRRRKAQLCDFSPDKQRAFFGRCDEWQKPIFLVLAFYGLRVGELTHLLVSDVSFEKAQFVIRSKPDLFWHVKTDRERVLPIVPELVDAFRSLVGGREEGFLFLHRDIVLGKKTPSENIASARDLARRVRQVADTARSEDGATEREAKRAVTAFSRSLGQIPEKRVRQEFMKITKKIGCPEVTRVHQLRHEFATRAQEQGLNPLLVQGILGHTTLDMTSKYTHFSTEAISSELSRLLSKDLVLRELISPASETDSAS